MAKPLLISRLTQTARALRTETASALSDHKLYPGQEPLLQELARRDGQLMGELAAGLRVSPPTLTKMVSRMSAQGLVRRERGFTDSREVRVHLLEPGRRAARELESTLGDLEQRITHGLTERERQMLGDGLASIRKNLQRRP